MKAVTYTKFGPPSVLHIADIPTPQPTSHELLIRIHATTVEKEDPDMRKSPGLNGFFKPKHPILGMMLAGEVVSIGQDVTKFHVGDQIYGSTGLSLGTYAEYIVLPEDAAIVSKPAAQSYDAVVSIVNGVVTALPFLREQGHLQHHQRILINGASGSVGIAAVQIAKYLEAHVTAICSTRHVEVLQKMGADRVIDYTQSDFTQIAQTYDIIFDTVGKTTYRACKPLLEPKGKYLATVPTLPILFQIIRSKIGGSRKVKFTATGLRKPEKKRKDLAFANQMFAEGKLVGVIDKTFAMAEMGEAHAYVAEGHKQGSVVIQIP